MYIYLLTLDFIGQHATQTCTQGRFGAEMGNDQFGACIMAHSPNFSELGTEDPQEAIIRISNTELNYVGQAYRYSDILFIYIFHDTV